ncbi:2-isopropylmalate synthase, partial [bacterium]
LHIRQKLEVDRERVLEMVSESVHYVKDHGLAAELSMEDGTRTDREFLKQVIGKAVESKVDRATVCDTVGILTPEKAYDLYSEIRKAFPKAILGVHCHDDFGLAVANSLAALRAGVDEVHGTINGLGERAGNASLEEIAVALRVIYGVKMGVRTELLYGASQLVSRLTGVVVQPNKAIVGGNAFAHESGIHTHAVLKNPLTYESIDPELVGAARQIVSGKHAGSHGIRRSLSDMGFNPSEPEFKEIVRRVKVVGDRGSEVTDADLYDIAQEVTGVLREPPLKLEEFTVVTGNRITPTASVKLTMNGNTYLEAATGVGPVDATLNAVSKAISPDERAHLDTYHVEAITGGTDAVVNVE